MVGNNNQADERKHHKYLSKEIHPVTNTNLAPRTCEPSKNNLFFTPIDLTFTIVLGSFLYQHIVPVHGVTGPVSFKHRQSRLGGVCSNRVNATRAYLRLSVCYSGAAATVICHFDTIHAAAARQVRFCR